MLDKSVSAGKIDCAGATGIDGTVTVGSVIAVVVIVLTVSTATGSCDGDVAVRFTERTVWAVGSVVVDAGSESKAVDPVSSADTGVERKDVDLVVEVGDKSNAGSIVAVTVVGDAVAGLDFG